MTTTQRVREALLELGSREATPCDVERIAARGTPVALSAEAYRRIDDARGLVDALVNSDTPAYGVTRGLGPLRDQPIPKGLQELFQEFVFTSHNAGTGRLLDRIEARAVMATRLAVMARGNSGGSRTLIDSLAALLNAGITPAIPEVGSVGSADLAQLAAVGSVIVGHGRVLGDGGGVVPAAEALVRAGLAPARLGAKDGHALVVGNAGSVGIGCLAAGQLSTLIREADLAAASSIDALSFNTGVFDKEVVEARAHPGQIRAGERMRALFSGGALGDGEVRPASLQDPLSFRTIPQVHGVLLEQLSQLNEVLTVELNSRPENPYIDLARGRMVSNGNFSALRLTLALEQARVALAHLMILSERRISVLISRLRTERPLSEQLAGYARNDRPIVPPVLSNIAATLSVRGQHLANPISLYTAVVGDGVEDHNSQAYSAARRLREAVDLAGQLFAIELLAAVGVAALDPEVYHRRRGPRLAGLLGRAARIYYQYDPTGETQMQLDALQDLLAEEAARRDGRCQPGPRGDSSTT